MKTTFLALIVASAAGVTSAADVAKSTGHVREQRTVETTVKSEAEYRRQFAEFRRDGWSIHFFSKQQTNEDGSVVWRWEVSRPPTLDSAPVDCRGT